MLGQVIVDDQGMFSAVAEMFRHRAAGVGGDVLHRRGIGGGRRDDCRIGHRAAFLQLLVNLNDAGALLPNGHVEAHDVLAALVEDGVDRNAGFPGLSIADDQFALAAADRRKRVDHFQTGLERFLNVLTVDDARRLDFDGAIVRRLDRRASVNRNTERIHNAAHERLADGDGGDALRTLDLVSFADVRFVAENRHADVVLFQVQHHPHGPAGELDQFAGHDFRQAVHARDAVAHAEDGADFVRFRFRTEFRQFLF